MLYSCTYMATVGVKGLIGYWSLLTVRWRCPVWYPVNKMAHRYVSSSVCCWGPAPRMRTLLRLQRDGGTDGCRSAAIQPGEFFPGWSVHRHRYASWTCPHRYIPISAVTTHKGKRKGRTLDIAPQVDMATTKALRYMARTKQRRTYPPYDNLFIHHEVIATT